jgi:hypothetical protein
MATSNANHAVDSWMELHGGLLKLRNHVKNTDCNIDYVYFTHTHFTHFHPYIQVKINELSMTIFKKGRPRPGVRYRVRVT